MYNIHYTMHYSELTYGGGDISVLSCQDNGLPGGLPRWPFFIVCISSNNINVIIIEIVIVIIFVTTPIIMWAAWSIAVTTGIL